MQRDQPWEYVDKTVTRTYRTCRKIGRGFYGVVWEIKRKHGGEPDTFALKKLLYSFKENNDAQRTYREISYLAKFGYHENILTLREVVAAPGDRHIYMITDLMESDLQKAMRCQALHEVHRPLIAYQVLRALKFIHSAGVMHRDIKPSNILLNSDCQAVLCDFGWARASPEIFPDDVEVPTTDYAATRWYRSPEMLLGGRHYTTAVDLWAFACTVGEMHLGRPLIPGTSTIDMLQKIEETFGKPLKHDSEAMGTLYGTLVFEHCPAGPPYKPLDNLFCATGDDELLDFLKLLLQYNPNKRMLALEGLTHPYLGQFHNPDDEPDYPGGGLMLRLADHQKYATTRYRDQIYADYAGIEAAMQRLRREGLPFDEDGLAESRALLPV